MIFCRLVIFLQAIPEIPFQSILRSSTVEAEQVNQLTNYFFLAAAFILALVSGLTIYILLKYTRDNSSSKEEKVLSSIWEIPMIGIPALLVAIFFYLNIRTLNAIHPAIGDEKPDVVITGHQWWWEAYYPGANVSTANEVHLPAGKKILLQMKSADVIHDWWIPQFGNKVDIVPGRNNYLTITIKKPGEFYGSCNEFCGAQHAHMRVKVIAQNGEDYDQWLNSLQQPAVSEKTFFAGKKLFIEKTCGNCHRIEGTVGISNSGPDLTHFAARGTFLAGMLENNLTNIENWIRNPQDIKPGAHMPDFLLADSSVYAIASYLNSLK